MVIAMYLAVMNMKLLSNWIRLRGWREVKILEGAWTNMNDVKDGGYDERIKVNGRELRSR